MVWETFNELLCKQATNRDISVLKAEQFNKFFSSVGEAIAESISNVDTDPMSYLNYSDQLPPLNFEQIGQLDIIETLKSFDPKKSVDMDDISLNLIKYVDTAIALPLAHIFNLSFSTGTFPDSFKTSRVIPIFKSGDPTSTDNYRPISLINTFGKILEKIVSYKLINHLNVNGIISKYQFGFQKGLSTEHNLIHLSNFIGRALNENKFCIGIFLDIKRLSM
jgi:hypothetical protein